MTTTNLKYTRDDVCDNLELPYSTEDYILFDTIGSKLENGDYELIDAKDSAYEELDEAKETIRELKDRVHKLEDDVKEKEDELNKTETKLWNAERELQEYKEEFPSNPPKDDLD